MIFLTITAELRDGNIHVDTSPSLEVLEGVKPAVIGQCAVLSDHLVRAVQMVLHHDGALPDQPIINTIGGEESDDKTN